MSYRKKHIKSKIRGIKPKKSVLKKPWIWALIVLSLVIFCILYLLLFYPGVQINNVMVIGAEKISAAELGRFTLDNAGVELINIGSLKLATKSIFLVDKEKIGGKVLKEYPAIEKAEIDRIFFRGISIDITERKPAGVYCAGEEPEPLCFLMDKNGFIFEQLAGELAGLPVVRRASADGFPSTGEKIIEEAVINAILKVHESLKKNFQVDIKQALLTSPVRLDVLTSERWKIYFNLDEDADIDSQIIRLNLLLASEISPEARLALQYIDLRFKDRAFYR